MKTQSIHSLLAERDRITRILENEFRVNENTMQEKLKLIKLQIKHHMLNKELNNMVASKINNVDETLQLIDKINQVEHKLECRIIRVNGEPRKLTNDSLFTGGHTIP